ncbi:MAG: Fe-S cluster assembly protein SufD, partial [Microbacterium arborescens]
MTSVTQAPATGEKGHIDPAAAFVPVQTRSERPASFDPAEFGTPTGREVNWKHTPLDRMQALLIDEAGPAGVISVDVS